jgi:hypothetical protein
MPLDTEVHLRVDLGADAPIEVIAGVLGELNKVCLLGGELQRHVSRNRALRQVLRRSDPFLDDPELDYLPGGREYYWHWYARFAEQFSYITPASQTKTAMRKAFSLHSCEGR